MLRGRLPADTFDRILARAPSLRWVHSATAGVERVLTPASRDRGLDDHQRPGRVLAPDRRVRDADDPRGLAAPAAAARAPGRAHVAAARVARAARRDRRHRRASARSAGRSARWRPRSGAGSSRPDAGPRRAARWPAAPATSPVLGDADARPGPAAGAPAGAARGVGLRRARRAAHRRHARADRGGGDRAAQAGRLGDQRRARRARRRAGAARGPCARAGSAARCWTRSARSRCRPTSPLYDLPNVILTPHTSWSSTRVLDRSVGLFCDNLRRYAAGEPLVNVVDPTAGY